MTDTGDRLVYMANQIAQNFAVRGDDAAAKATAEHIRNFWAPHMLGRIFVLMDQPGHRLSPIATRALVMVRAAKASVA